MREPAWWYASAPTATARLLAPAASLWARAAERRFARTTPYRASLPVVCIGNFTVGGTGKTPLATRIAADLAALGRTPVILSRGHGGRIRGPHWVDPRAETAADVGDEPLLHAARWPVVVARDRAAGARLIEARGRPDDVMVMDDGLQNPTLARDLAIAVVDGRRGLGNGMVMPAGPLRAALAFQARLVDAVVVNLPEDLDPAAWEVASRLGRSFDGPVLTAVTRPAEAIDWLTGLPVVAWAGIGNPARFFALLERHGARVVERLELADHALPVDAVAERLLATARRLGARLVTTEKDLVRLAGGTGPQTALAAASRAIPIALHIGAHDAGRLAALIEAAMRPRAPAG